MSFHRCTALDLRRLRLQDDHVANRTGGGRCGDDRKRQVHQRVAVTRQTARWTAASVRHAAATIEWTTTMAKIHDASLVPGFAATPPLHRDLRASQAA